MKEINIIIASGGGSKAISYIGVIKKLEELVDEKKIILNLKELCGVSAGSIIGFLYLLGYTYKELEDEVIHKRFEQLKDIRITNFFTYYGIDSGKNIMDWIEKLIIKKGFDKNITFKEFYDKINKKFVVIATNLNKYRYSIFDYENTPDVKIIKAIRMSISIPFYFTYEKYNNDIHVDGALIDNYPIKLYRNNLSNVLGFKIINYGELDEHDVEYRINSIDTFIYNVIYCFIVQKEKETTLNNEYKKCTIYIYTNDKNAVNFAMTKEEKLKLIDIGYTASCEFFDKNNKSEESETVEVGKESNIDTK